MARNFECDKLQNLWEQGITSDKDLARARDAVQSGQRQFPPDLAHKTLQI